jgi:hypothetical protein
MSAAVVGAVLWTWAFQERTLLPDKMAPEAQARCQAATVHLVTKGGGLGISRSGFFVGDQGYIVTHLPVAELRRLKVQVTVVVNSGREDNKRYDARIVQTDGVDDLVLLKIEATGTASLRLGDDGRLAETDAVWTFGYSGGDLPRRGYAGQSVDFRSGTVTALSQSKEGAVERIQTSALLHPGFSGGPLVGRDGQVFGMIVADIQDPSRRFAIPASRLKRFLAGGIAGARVAPERLGENGGWVRIEADVVEVLEKADRVWAQIGVDGGIVEVPMNREAGGWAAPWEAPPLDPAMRDRIEAALTMRDRTSRTGTLRRLEFTLKHSFGTLAIPAGEIREIRFGEGGAPDVVRTSKETFEGEVVQRGVDLGEEIPAAQIASARFARVVGMRCPVRVRARLEGKEVSTEAGMVVIGEPERGPESIEVAMKGNRVQKRVPGTIHDIKPAAGGRMLAIHFKTRKVIELFDPMKLEFVRRIRLAEEEALFAAGRTKLVVCYPAKSILVRYDLRTMEKELTVSMPVAGVVRNLEMGWNSDGPALLRWARESQTGIASKYDLLDVERMKLVDLGPSGGGAQGVFSDRDKMHLRLSADGRWIGTWSTDISRSGAGLARIGDAGLEWSSGFNSAGFVLPGTDAEYLYTQRGLFGRTLRGVKECENLTVIPFPGGVFYLSYDSWRAVTYGNPVQASIHALSNHQKLLTMDEPLFNIDRFVFGGWDEGNLTLDKRIWPIPGAKIIVTVPTTNDTLVIRRLDPEAALEASGIDYLFVASAAPTEARVAATWEYPVAVRSKRGDAGFKLEIAPDGMAVDDRGRITWTPKEAGSFSVVLRVSDAGGQEIYHQFNITVR